MIVVCASEARRRLSELARRAFASGDRIVIARRGRKMAAVVSIGDLALLTTLEDKADLHAAKAALREARSRGTVPWKSLKTQLGS